MKQKIVVSLFLFLSSLIVEAAQNAKGIPEQQIFRMRLSGEPATLDWSLAHTMIETYVLMNLMEGLVAFDSSLKVVPALAKSWKVTEKGTRYTFQIRKNVKWSDGVELKAQDFVYSWKRLLSPVTAASYAYFLFDIVGAREFHSGKMTDFSKVGIKALNDHTFTVKLKYPVAYWKYIPSFWVTFPLRKDIVEKFGTAWAKPGAMQTVGPFTLHHYDVEVGRQKVTR